MKRVLLLSVAALLIAEPAFAQSSGSTGATSPERAPGAQQPAPAEKMAPDSGRVPIGSSRMPGDPAIPRPEAETTGQGAGTSPAPTGRSNTTGQGAAGTSASLTDDQRARIWTSIKQQNVDPVTNVSFAITIGTAIPQDVRRVPLPRSVIDVYPAWIGYEFIMVGGDIVIIDPRTLRIVAILEA